MAPGSTTSGNGAEASGEDRLRAIYEQQETRSAKALEQLVNMPAFGALLARGAENVAALTRISTDVADMVLRNLRLAGRADITRLARQLHRSEDKLERVLQEVEALRDELAGRSGSAPASRRSPASAGNGAARGSPRTQRKRASRS